MEKPAITKVEIKEIRKELARFRRVFKKCQWIIENTSEVNDTLKIKVVKEIDKKFTIFKRRAIKITNHVDYKYYKQLKLYLKEKDRR